MVSSQMDSARSRSVSAELPRDEAVPTRCGPMMQQGTASGYEMHPQEFVRLIGCHEARRQKESVAQRLST